MVSDDKKIKTNPAPKNEVPPKNKSTSNESTSDVAPTAVEGGEIAAASPSGYSRGEGQKPVTQAYKENWNIIFGKEKKR